MRRDSNTGIPHTLQLAPVRRRKPRRPDHPRTLDLTGETFGRLNVIMFAGYKYDREGDVARAHWACWCSCGNVVAVRSDNLWSENTRSCGCLRRGPRASNGGAAEPRQQEASP
jgi:hypothetical protein